MRVKRLPRVVDRRYWFDRQGKRPVFSAQVYKVDFSPAAGMKRAVIASAPSGRLAQLVRAPALQAGGRRFESCTAHHSSRTEYDDKVTCPGAGNNRASGVVVQ